MKNSQFDVERAPRAVGRDEQAERRRRARRAPRARAPACRAPWEAACCTSRRAPRAWGRARGEGSSRALRCSASVVGAAPRGAVVAVGVGGARRPSPRRAAPRNRLLSGARAAGRPASRRACSTATAASVRSASSRAACRPSRRAGPTGPIGDRVPALQTAHVVHDVPAIQLLDAVVRRHEAAAVADHAADVAVGAAGRRRRRTHERDRREALRDDRAVSLPRVAMADGAVDRVVLAAVEQRARVGGHRVRDRRHGVDRRRQAGARHGVARRGGAVDRTPSSAGCRACGIESFGDSHGSSFGCSLKSVNQEHAVEQRS